MKNRHQIINGDSRSMTELEDRSVQLAVTSPPYWQLKHYGSHNEVGFNDTYEEYINHLNLVWAETYRVLDDGCRLCVNIGEQYARAVYYGRYKVIPIRTEIIKFCETIGFDYMGAIIWQKVATTNTSGGATIMGSFPYPRNGILKLDYEFILIFKKDGKPLHEPSPEQKARSKMTIEEWNTYFSGHWNFTGEKQNKHLAMFPVELPRRLIKMFTFAGDTVLDPFLGSGTTSLAALELNRHSVGYEINDEFIPVIEEKMGQGNFEVIKQNQSKKSFSHAINKLPYIFKDPSPLQIQVDPKALSFGSKIDKNSGKYRETYYTVKEIQSPNRLVVQNKKERLTVELIGITVSSDQHEAAMEYLKNKLNKQRVFLKFDDAFPQNREIKSVYLYLQNRAFVNAHLIKAGLADVDGSAEFKHKTRFLRYKSEAAAASHS